MRPVLKEVIWAALIIGFAIFVGVQKHKSDTLSWPNVLTKIQKSYPAIKHIKQAELLALMNKKTPLVLLDTRAPKEFAISHLKGAIQLDPQSSKQALLTKLKGKIAGKTIVFYCSVGMRSSALASLVQHDLLKNGAAAVYNLHQGLFGWGNKQLPMYNDKGQVKFVHPYDQHWGVLLNQALWKAH